MTIPVSITICKLTEWHYAYAKDNIGDKVTSNIDTL